MLKIGNVLGKILALFDMRERLQAAGVVLLALCSAAGESIGILSVMPILAVGANPAIIKSNKILRVLYSELGFQSNHAFIVFLGLSSLGALLLAVSFQALTQWCSAQFVQMRNYTISRRLMLEYARRDYVFFLSSNSANLAETLLTEIQTVINGIFTPVMLGISEGCVAASLLIVLAVTAPVLSLGAILLLGGGYGLIFLLVGPYLDRVGAERLTAIQHRFLTASEMFGGIKEIRLLGCEKVYFDRFSHATYVYSRTQAVSQLVSNLPQYIMQAVAYGTILLFLIYLLSSDRELSHVLPTIGLFALAGRRLLPALQNVYAQASLARFSQSALDKLLEELRDAPLKLTISGDLPPPLRFEKEIRLDNLNFQYPTSKQMTLSNISLRIPIGSRIGFVGPTGSGKTTIVDILLGLLSPSSGSLLVDGVSIQKDNLRNWQRLFGYVPQHIYLTDESVARNIAFGIAPEEIDLARVERVARIANIHEFVVNEMPHGYDTVIGERGVRLSGGQRQRLGIARALYRDPKVLVFDEATSALDNITERELMKALNEISTDRTIIMIAHRLTTVRDCDQIFLLEHGRLKASGTYNDLVTHNERFRAMAASSH